MTPLTWTTDPPTTPGWYWVRPQGIASNRRVYWVQMYHDRDGVLRVQYGGKLVNPKPADFPEGTLWAGPIPRPVEA